jgi:integrase
MRSVEPIRDPKKIEAMKRYLRGDSLRNYLLFTLGINTGLRVKDLLRLKVTDVLDERAKITERISIRENKTGKEKIFRLNETAQKAIKEYIADAKPEPGDYLIQSREGENKPLTTAQVNNILTAAARACGVAESVGATSLRKTFGYHARKRGVPGEVLMRIFNHASLKITQRYIGITQDELEEVYLSLNI